MGENVGKMGEVGDRELVLVASVRWGKERDMTRGWLNFFWHTNAWTWATHVRVMKGDQTVQCDVLTHCAHLYMLYEWVFCSHFFPRYGSSLPTYDDDNDTHRRCAQQLDMTRGWQQFCSHLPSVVWKFFSKQPKLVLTLKKFTNHQTMMNAWNSNCSSSICFDPTLLTRTKLSTGLSATLNRTSTACARADCIVIFFNSLKSLSFSLAFFVDCEEWFYNLVESLPCVRRATSCILFSQSQVVDVMVAELLLYSVWESNVPNFRILSAFVATYEWFSKAIRSNNIVSCSVHPLRDKESLYL